MNIFEIPLRPSTAQKVKITLNGTVYTTIVRWNDVSICWIMDLYDEAGVVPVLCGVPLITGTNLLGQYAYLDIDGGLGGAMVVQTVAVGHPPDEVPSFTDLGTDGHLYYVTP